VVETFCCQRAREAAAIAAVKVARYARNRDHDQPVHIGLALVTPRAAAAPSNM
jgi:hypothetical protein